MASINKKLHGTDPTDRQKQLYEAVVKTVELILADAAARAGGESDEEKADRLRETLNPEGDKCVMITNFLFLMLEKDEDGSMLEELQQTVVGLLAFITMMDQPEQRQELNEKICGAPFLHHLGHLMFEVGVAWALVTGYTLENVPVLPDEFADMKDWDISDFMFQTKPGTQEDDDDD